MPRTAQAPVGCLEPWLVDLLQCPVTGDALVLAGDHLVSRVARGPSYEVSSSGLPLFAKDAISETGRKQRAHYDKIAATYLTNLAYPHTQEYMTALDRAFLTCVSPESLGTIAEICCGRGEAFHLLKGRFKRGIGVDVSLTMLEAARAANKGCPIGFVQGDATMLPLRDGVFDNVFIFGGIHHVSDRSRLFSEVARILKGGGAFYFREPVSDFAPWQWIRAVIYRLSHALDHTTERPLRQTEVTPLLERAGLCLKYWRTHGFLGFCLFMNSDVLIFNRSFRFIPGIRRITRSCAKFDEWVLNRPGLRHAGLQVVGKAVRPVDMR
jgi:ubiquinone/menaquinone biosynthesis C-methylase UbiE